MFYKFDLVQRSVEFCLSSTMNNPNHQIENLISYLTDWSLELGRKPTPRAWTPPWRHSPSHEPFTCGKSHIPWPINKLTHGKSYSFILPIRRRNQTPLSLLLSFIMTWSVGFVVVQPAGLQQQQATQLMLWCNPPRPKVNMVVKDLPRSTKGCARNKSLPQGKDTGCNVLSHSPTQTHQRKKKKERLWVKQPEQEEKEEGSHTSQERTKFLYF